MGAGRMGRGIALAFAYGGYEVDLIDLRPRTAADWARLSGEAVEDMASSLAHMRVLVWAFALCFAGVAVLSWRYLFAIPIVFSIVITLCLAAAAWRSAAEVGLLSARCASERVRFLPSRNLTDERGVG